MVLANLPSALSGKAGHIFQAEYRTFREVFPAVYVFPRHSRAEKDPGSPAWWARPRNVFLAATLEEEPKTKITLMADAEQRWGHLSRPPHKRHNTELLDLTFHAANLLEPGALNRQVQLSEVSLLTDDYGPVDTLVFDVGPVAE